MKNIYSRILVIILLFATTASFLFPQSTYAASLSPISDTMTTQLTGATADHTFTWTQATGHTTTAADTIAIAFTSGYFTASASSTWQNADFAMTDSVHTALAPVSVCSSGNYTVAVTGTTQPTFTITFCSGWSSPSTGSSVTFKIFGTASTGTGTLTNTTQSDSIAITFTDTGSNTDTGLLGVSIGNNDVVTVTATVNPVLTFSISSNTIALGTLSSASTASSSHTISVSSNASGGFAVAYNGPTLTSASSTIPAYSTGSSVVGTAGFGINLVANTVPSVGAAASGSGCVSGLSSGYGSLNVFNWVPSTTTQIASVTAPTSCVYTVSYVANISSITPAGNYSSATTYTATGTF